MASAPISEIVNKFFKQYTELIGAVRKDILAALPHLNKSNYERIINGILKKHNIKSVLFQDMQKDLMSIIQANLGAPVNSVMVKGALLSEAWTPEKELFSSRINKLSRLDELLSTIRIAMNKRESMLSIAEQIFRTGIQKGDTTALINKLAESSRLLAKNAGDIDLYRKLMYDVNKTVASASKLVNPDTSTLRRAYLNVVKAAKTMDKAALRKAVDYAVYFKQRYNTVRIANTEFSRAYGNTKLSKAYFDSDVSGVGFTLSSAHHIYDICNVYTAADLYGMGKGIYPKDRTPKYPFHPNCKCGIKFIYEIEAEQADESDFNGAKGKAFINSLSISEKRSILGVEGIQAFNKNPNSWESLVRGFNHPAEFKPQIPKGAFANG